ncbi:phage holin family protein [Caecibacteroides pullorum]|uniref:Phage holin family protein n=1 Tax=Caecibacteroides pullorum TaxID=2725562 RepID=A0AA41D797_9BACT|nr:phage holin family protein [Caecibacteroides pullorum]MBM6856486.1 phage holin family protein [Caecibacteroides pullorum]MBV8057492.1 phage holin family protein [Caecibacteroides pullorum]
MEEYLKFIVQDIRGGVTIIFICSMLICIACLMDMWTGIDAARANKEKIRSKPLRKTGVKIVDYFRLIIIFVLIDILGLCFPWYNLPYGAIIGTAGVLFVEGFSVVENLRRKRSHAAEVADVAAKIVKCLTTEDAEKIIKMIKEEKK